MKTMGIIAIILSIFLIACGGYDLITMHDGRLSLFFGPLFIIAGITGIVFSPLRKK